MGLVRIETLPAPSSDIISGGQHFKTLTAAYFRLFMFSYFLSGFAELDILCRFFPTHSGEKLLDAEWNVTFWRVVNDCVYADSHLRANNATVFSLGVAFPFSISEIDRSVFPSSSARPTCVRPSLRRASDTAAPKALFTSRIDSPFIILI